MGYTGDDDALKDGVQRLSRDWVASKRRGADGDRVATARDDEIVDALIAMRRAGKPEAFEAYEAFVRDVCATVAPDEKWVVSNIGAGPLEDLLRTWPDPALKFIEREAEQCETLREALTNVWITPLGDRVDSILAKYGKGSGRA